MTSFAIIGAGIMGADITHLAASQGFAVLLFDRDLLKTGVALDRIRARLERYVSQGRMNTDAVQETLARITICDTIACLAGADIVLECVTEDIGIKQAVFRDLDAVCGPGAILASNTSSLSITSIASVTRRPESVIGIHFLIPAHIMKLAEIIPGLSTTRETVELAKSVVKKLGKETVESRDYPGFMLNRMLLPMINEAIYILYEGVGTVETIDRVMKTGLNQPMGPLALADMIGLDVVLAVAEEMFRGFGDSKYRPCPLLKKYVSAGFLGKKTGRGFYLYNESGRQGR